MKIRPITLADIPAIIRHGAEMHYESIYSHLTYSPQRVYEMCCTAIDSNNHLAVVAEHHGEIVGMLAACVFQYAYGDESISTDMLVYVDPAKRGGRAFLALVSEYIEWAKSKNVALILLGQTTGVDTEAVTELYKKIGFKHIGGQFCLINGG